MQCKRINLLIGKPNVGKSNVLEALSLYCAPIMLQSDHLFDGYVRAGNASKLFHFGDRETNLEIISDIGIAGIRYHQGINLFDYFTSSDSNVIQEIPMGNTLGQVADWFREHHASLSLAPNELEPRYYTYALDFKILSDDSHTSFQTPVRKYDFQKSLTDFSNHFGGYLLPPYGQNLFEIVAHDRSLADEFGQIVEEYGLKLLLDEEESTFQVVRLDKHRISSVPFSQTASTLRRLLFHLAAIRSNSNSIIALEEPESHSFPPYIQNIAQEIIDAESNQFFIATHSPYMLNTILENAPADEVAVFVGTYQNYETKLHLLPEDKLSHLLNYGVDLFYNLDWAING